MISIGPLFRHRSFFVYWPVGAIMCSRLHSGLAADQMRSPFDIEVARTDWSHALYQRAQLRSSSGQALTSVTDWQGATY